MSVLIPQITRPVADDIIAEARGLALLQLAAAMPREAPVHLSPVGGRRIELHELRTLREAVLGIARGHGYPASRSQAGDVRFDADAALVLRHHLAISPHEASSEGAWSYLTCCWLLDIAFWRFGASADARRLYGHVNRNAFRRLWWRAEVLSDGAAEQPFHGLGEDELVSIMERPTLARDARLARTIMRTFAERLASIGPSGPARMDLMRDFTKRILRLTPFVDFNTMDQDALHAELRYQLDRSVAAISGLPAPQRTVPVQRAPELSASVEILEANGLSPSSSDEEVNDAEASIVAIDIARRTGRVTNSVLREVVPGLDAEGARQVLTRLTEQGRLERRGAKRGTHYVPPPTAIEQSASRPNTGVLRRLLQRNR